MKNLIVKYNDEKCALIYNDCTVNLKMTEELREFVGRYFYAKENGFKVQVEGNFTD